MTLRTISSLLVFCLALAPIAYAADDGETIEQAKDAIKAIDKARKAKDVSALGEACIRAVELHNGLEGASIRKKLQAAVGSVLRSKRAAALHGEALNALEQMDDGDGVFQQLKSKLPANGDAKVDDHGLHAIQIVGSVRSKKGIKYLSALAFNGKSAKARVEAVTSLGKYRELKDGRVDALKALLDLLVKLRPEEGRPIAEAQRNAWAALEQPIVIALDELTFKELKKSQAWIDWYASNKSKLEKVFGND